MEFKSLFLGFAFAVGVFAIKSGAGLFYMLSMKRNLKTRVAALALFAFLYFLLFAGSAWVLQQVNLMHHAGSLQSLLQSGTLIHVVMSCGLITWGILLLRQRDSSGAKSHGWLALVVSCPICVVVIFTSTVFLFSYFPDATLKALAGAYLVFMGISVLSILGLAMWNRHANFQPNGMLGSAMLIIGVYFFLSVSLAPLLSHLDEVYRLATYPEEGDESDIRGLLLLISLVCAGFAAGFLFMKKRIGRLNQCN